MPALLAATPVLVLNQNFEPLNVCQARRAVVLVAVGKAEVVAFAQGALHAMRQVFPLPSVIRLVHAVFRPRHPVRLSRHEVFIRDDYTCQYCGRKTRDLTLDHVLPRRKGGTHSWENVVSACRLCNHRKAGRTPQEARMRLARPPQPPQPSAVFLFYEHLRTRRDWLPFIPARDRLLLERNGHLEGEPGYEELEQQRLETQAPRGG